MTEAAKTPLTRQRWEQRVVFTTPSGVGCAAARRATLDALGDFHIDTFTDQALIECSGARRNRDTDHAGDLTKSHSAPNTATTATQRQHLSLLIGGQKAALRYRHL